MGRRPIARGTAGSSVKRPHGRGGPGAPLRPPGTGGADHRRFVAAAFSPKGPRTSRSGGPTGGVRRTGRAAASRRGGPARTPRLPLRAGTDGGGGADHTPAMLWIQERYAVTFV